MRAHQLLNPWNQRNEDNIIQMAREAHAQKFLKKRLASVTKTTDSGPPRAMHMKHLDLRMKKKQMIEDRKQVIANENRKLMEKMTDIVNGKGKSPLFTTPKTVACSLNQREREEYVNRINLDNKIMIERLRKTSGWLDVKKMEEDYQLWLENRKIGSKAYKREKRAAALARRREAFSRQPSSGMSVSTAKKAVDSMSSPQQTQKSNFYNTSDNFNMGTQNFDENGINNTFAPSFRTARELREQVANDPNLPNVPTVTALVSDPDQTGPIPFLNDSSTTPLATHEGETIRFGLEHNP